MAHRTVEARFNKGIARASGLGGLYFLLAAASLILTRFDGQIAFLWLANGVLTPFLANLPVRRWPLPAACCGLASAIASTAFGGGAAVAGPVTVLMIGEATLGAWLLRRWLGTTGYFDTLGRLACFVAIVGGVAPFVAAFGGAAVGATLFGMPVWTSFAAWFLVHALGALAVAPVAVLVAQGDGWSWRGRWQGAAADAGLLAVALAVDCAVFLLSPRPLLFLPGVPLLLLALRGRPLAGAFGFALLAIVGGTASAMGLGPIALMTGDAGERSLFFQFYLAVTFLMTLPVAAEVRRRHTASRELARGHAIFRLIADQSSDALSVFTRDGHCQYMSPAIRTMLGLGEAELVGRHALDLVVADDRERVAAVMREVVRSPHRSFRWESRGLAMHGPPVWLETHARAVMDDDGQVAQVVSTIRDISLQKAVERQLVDAAEHDALTGLANRRGFDCRVDTLRQRALARGTSLSVAIIDIDLFKQVNDRHGHPAGDEVLKAVAALLVESLRAEDVVARLGGEEFGLLLPSLNADGAERLCERLRRAINARPITVGAAAIPVSVSIGLARFEDYRTAADAIAAADAALYRAKRQGRNRLQLAA